MVATPRQEDEPMEGDAATATMNDAELESQINQGLESAYQELETAFNKRPSIDEFPLERFMDATPAQRFSLDDLLSAAGMMSASTVQDAVGPNGTPRRRGGAP